MSEDRHETRSIQAQEVEDEAWLDGMLAELTPPPPTGALRARVMAIGAEKASQPGILGRWLLGRAEIRRSAVPLRWVAAVAAAAVVLVVALELAPIGQPGVPAPEPAVAALEIEPETGFLTDVPIVDAGDEAAAEPFIEDENTDVAEAEETDEEQTPLLVVSSLSGLALE